MAKHKEAGVFAAVAMGLSGIVTTAIIPLLFSVIRHVF
jgi:putative effector of murein hydrolase